MKALDIAFKDLSRSFRSAFFMVFGFALPLLTAALFYFAFGGLASDESGFELPVTEVQIVNLDEAQAGFSAGQLMADVLTEALPEIIHTTDAPDAAAARLAVDRQEAAVAVIIPSGFTAAVFAPGGEAVVELYQDPTLTLGPGIVKGIVEPLVDGLVGSKIATGVALEQLAVQGVAVDAAMLQEIAMQYSEWAESLGQGQEGGRSPYLDVQDLPTREQEPTDSVTSMIGLIMAGMMVFYVFFSGAAAAQSILQEEEAGTLPRLFTTPTALSAILGGKFVAIFAMLIIQVTVLVVASALIFNIQWGEPWLVALVTLGLAILASCFGIFITSLLKNSRQAGIVYGGVMTVMGMIGMIGIFTAPVPGTSNPLSTASLIVPQGWAVRAWELLLQGGAAGDVLPSVGVMLVFGIIFFGIGLFRFRKRYA